MYTEGEQTDAEKEGGTSIMLPLVEFPEIVERYAPWFEEVFSPQAYIEFKRYVSGLMVLENKTVEAINRLMASTVLFSKTISPLT